MCPRVKEWCRMKKVPRLSDVKFSFEHGDGTELQANLRDRFLDDEYPEPLFRTKKNRYSDIAVRLDYGLVPFQAADVSLT